MVNTSEIHSEFTSIEGVTLLKRESFQDNRGSFFRLLCTETLSDSFPGLTFVQSNVSYNPTPGTVRGLHGQKQPYSETKLVTCIDGSIYDVVVDMREHSPTFLRHEAFSLTSPSVSIMVPPGCVHGFQTTRPGSIVHYNVSQKHIPEYEIIINPFDPTLAIHWPLPVSLISPKDNGAPYL